MLLTVLTYVIYREKKSPSVSKKISVVKSTAYAVVILLTVCSHYFFQDASSPRSFIPYSRQTDTTAYCIKLKVFLQRLREQFMFNTMLVIYATRRKRLSARIIEAWCCYSKNVPALIARQPKYLKKSERYFPAPPPPYRYGPLVFTRSHDKASGQSIWLGADNVKTRRLQVS